MGKIGKLVPGFVKRPIVRFTNWCGRLKGKVYLAARAGKIWFPDKAFQKWDYKIHTGRKLNMKNPQTYCEKLQWLKYYYRNPEYTKLVDKYAVREYVKEKIGEEYLVPLYGVYDSFDEIDFDKLPEQFVLKCTHDSGSVVICKDKKSFDFDKAREKLEFCLNRNQFYLSREWYYKNVSPRIIAEKYLEAMNDVGFTDYKFMCFSGEPKFMFTCTDRFTESGMKENFFDMNWRPLPFKQCNIDVNNKDIPKPVNFELMKKFAGILSAGIPHIRVDYFEYNGNLYFSELTFFDSGGRTPFEPEEYNKIIGDYIVLPKKMR